MLYRFSCQLKRKGITETSYLVTLPNIDNCIDKRNPQQKWHLLTISCFRCRGPSWTSFDRGFHARIQWDAKANSSSVQDSIHKSFWNIQVIYNTLSSRGRWFQSLLCNCFGLAYKIGKIKRPNLCCHNEVILRQPACTMDIRKSLHQSSQTLIGIY